ncbi:MAG TPA: CbtA family protein [Xanthobacteraceae bacterium]|nr:CbtA family protein [Xanthobacteraceae bacterium]
MVKALLVRGMLAGAMAGLLAFGFAYIFGEVEIDYAIGFEQQMAAHAQAGAAGAFPEHEEELVSRAVQAGIGLLTAVAVYGAGIGGLFAIVFAFVYGRMGRLGPRATAALLAAAGGVSVAVVPFLKYPANPPAVGNPETLGSRTALFLVMIAISLAGLMLAIGLARRLVGRFGLWPSAAIGGAAFSVVIAVAYLLLPDVQEIPAQFSADALWRFRAASLGMQLLMWAVLGLVFGMLTQRLLEPRGSARR